MKVKVENLPAKDFLEVKNPKRKESKVNCTDNIV